MNFKKLFWYNTGITIMFCVITFMNFFQINRIFLGFPVIGGLILCLITLKYISKEDGKKYN
jgi:hypothetical protein